MSQDTDFLVASKDAATTVEDVVTFIKAGFEHNIADHLKVTITSNLRHTMVKEKQFSNADEVDLSDVLKQFRDSPSLDFFNIVMTYQVGNQSASITLTRSADVGTTFKIHNPQLFRDTLSKAIDSAFVASTRAELILEHLPDQLKKEYVSQQNWIRVFQEQTAKLGDHLITAAKNNQDTIDSLQAKVIEDDQKRRTEFEEHKKSEQEKLDEDRKKFEEEKDKWDERESKVVRRDLIEKIQKLLDDFRYFRTPLSTTILRIPIALACLALAGAGGTLAWWAAKQILASEAVQYPHYALFAAGSILTVTTSVYFLRWWNAIFRSHHDFQFRNAMLQSDMLRASWIAELIFEAHESDKKIEIPEQVLEFLAAHLFEPVTGPSAHHPIDDLQKYAKRFKKFAVGKDGIQVEARDDQST